MLQLLSGFWVFWLNFFFPFPGHLCDFRRWSVRGSGLVEQPAEERHPLDLGTKLYLYWTCILPVFMLYFKITVTSLVVSWIKKLGRSLFLNSMHFWSFEIPQGAKVGFDEISNIPKSRQSLLYNLLLVLLCKIHDLWSLYWSYVCLYLGVSHKKRSERYK